MKTLITYGSQYGSAEHYARKFAASAAGGCFHRVQIFHLRGAIDYGKLNLKHRTMMALLYAKAKGLPGEKKNAETQAIIETYGKQVSFVDDTAVMELVNSIYQE